MTTRWIRRVMKFVVCILTGEVVVLILLHSDPQINLEAEVDQRRSDNYVNGGPMAGESMAGGYTPRWHPFRITGRPDNRPSISRPPPVLAPVSQRDVVAPVLKHDVIAPVLTHDVMVRKRKLMLKSMKYKSYLKGILNCRSGTYFKGRPRQRHRPLDESNLYAPEPRNLKTENVTDVNVKGRKPIIRYNTNSQDVVTEVVQQMLKGIIDDLTKILGRNRIRILDVPCGKLSWIPAFLDELDAVTIDYTGMDNIPKVIKDNQEYFRFIPNMRFVLHDISRHPLPGNATFDLVISRQMNRVLTRSDTLTTLRHIDESGSLFLFASTALRSPHSTKRDPRARTGKKSPHNLLENPFWLENPVCVGEEIKGVSGMGLWQLPAE